jgi:hypothetical protein
MATEQRISARSVDALKQLVEEGKVIRRWNKKKNWRYYSAEHAPSNNPKCKSRKTEKEYA